VREERTGEGRAGVGGREGGRGGEERREKEKEFIRRIGSCNYKAEKAHDRLSAGWRPWKA
jgi:hypothetical protein